MFIQIKNFYKTFGRTIALLSLWLFARQKQLLVCGQTNECLGKQN